MKTLIRHGLKAALWVERAAELAQLSTQDEEASSGPENTPEVAQQLLSERLTATAAIIDAMRHAQGRAFLRCDPPNEPSPLGDDEGDELPRRRGVRLAQARKRSAYFASAFYLAA